MRNRMRALLGALLIIGLTGGRASAEEVAVATTIGGDPVVAATTVSRELYPRGAEAAVVLSTVSFADALSALPFANAADAPVLFSTPETLSKATAEELKRLSPSKVYLVGGKAVLSHGVSDEVRGLWETEERPTVFRFDGRDRYETSMSIVYAMRPPGGEKLPVTLVNGTRLVPSLSAAATGMVTPILAVPANEIIHNYRVNSPALFLRDKASEAVIVGPREQVYSQTYNALAEGTFAEKAEPLPVERVEAADEYALSAMFAEKAERKETVVVADAKSYMTAVVAARFAAKKELPLLLVPGRGIALDAIGFLRRHQVKSLIFFGSAESLSATVRSQLVHAGEYGTAE